MKSIQEIKDWLESSPNCSIWVEDPERHKERIGLLSVEKSFLSYRIFCKQAGQDLLNVRHRYSEFESLRSGLMERFCQYGILVPKLPPKKSISALLNMDASNPFVKERTYGLSLFCEAVISNPFLRNDRQWREFIGMQPVVGDSASENFGESFLFATLAQLEVPYRFTLQQRISDLKEESVVIEKSVQAVIDKFRANQSAELALSTSNQSLLATMRFWADTESRRIRSLAGHPFDSQQSILREKETVSHSTKCFSDLWSAKVDASSLIASYDGLLMGTALEHELSQIDALRDLLKSHDSIVATMEAAQRATGSAAATAATIISECEEKLGKFYKGLIYFTLPMMSRQRSALIRRACASICAVQLTSAAATQMACLDMFKELAMSPSDAVTTACNTLDMLGVKPLQQSFSSSYGAVDDDVSYLPPPSQLLDGLFDAGLLASGKLPSAPPAPIAAAASNWQNPLKRNPATVDQIIVPDVSEVADSRARPPVPVSPPNPLATRRSSAVAAQSQVPSASPSFKQTDKSLSLLDDLTGTGSKPAEKKADSVWGDL